MRAHTIHAQTPPISSSNLFLWNVLNVHQNVNLWPAVFCLCLNPQVWREAFVLSQIYFRSEKIQQGSLCVTLKMKGLSLLLKWFCNLIPRLLQHSALNKKKKDGTYFKVSCVHCCTLAHFQEVWNPSNLQYDVNSHVTLEACMQEIFKDVHVCKQIHDHSNDL